MPKRLRHQNNNCPLEIYPVEQDLAHKPVGLWYSVGNEWIEWCRIEEFYTQDPKFIYALAVDESKLLRLVSVLDILAFTAEFGDPHDSYNIDWPAVAQRWGGIEIAPYQWELRLDRRTCWYYSWDVASGCLWEPSMLLSYTKEANDESMEEVWR